MRCNRKVADDDSRGTRNQVIQRSRSLASARVEHALMAFTHEGGGGSAPESVRRAGNEDRAMG